jgi:hypothetical protein
LGAGLRYASVSRVRDARCRIRRGRPRSLILRQPCDYRARPVRPHRRTNTVVMLSQAYSPLGFRIVDGVVGAGFPQKPSHSAVFAQIDPAGSRLSELARGANMSPQAMGGVVDELESLGYVI